MIKKPYSAPGMPGKLRQDLSSKSLRQAEGHDEWLLDEALAETFPASDPIAVTPIRPLRANPPRRSRKVEGSSRIFDRHKVTESGVLETAVECDHCHTGIAATVALSFEGADYIYYFCGPQCLEAWRTAAGADDE